MAAGRLFHTDGQETAKPRYPIDVCSAPVVAGCNQWMHIIVADDLGRCPLGHGALVNMLRRRRGGTSKLSDSSVKSNSPSDWQSMDALEDWRDACFSD